MTTISAGALLIVAVSSLAEPAFRDAGDPTSGTAPSALVQVVGSCPSQSAVTDALRPVLGKDGLRRTSELPRVIDLGDRYVVSAAGQSSPYADPSRDCAERARVSAVFIALALNPPIVPVVAPPTPPPPPEPPAPPPEPAAPPSPPAVFWKRVAVSGRLDHGFETEGGPAVSTAGAEVHGALGWDAWGVAATGGVLLPVTATFKGIAVREQRFPLSLSLVLKGRPTPEVELSGNLGVALTVLTLRANGINENAPSTRIDVGARWGIEIAGPRFSDGFSAFVGIHGEYFPRLYVLDVDQTGQPLGIGSTHNYWGAASLGISFEQP